VREGLTRDDDKLPKKMAKELQGGRSDGFKFTPEELEDAKDTYYALAGWDVATGTPTSEKLADLGLDWLA
jgi:aldehyde:ferredoxin oxidoreductase